MGLPAVSYDGVPDRCDCGTGEKKFMFSSAYVYYRDKEVNGRTRRCKFLYPATLYCYHCGWLYYEYHPLKKQWTMVGNKYYFLKP